MLLTDGGKVEEARPMKLKIELPSDLEALRAAEASAQGVSLEQHTIGYLIATACPKDERSRAIRARPGRPSLPRLQGTIIGSLRRQDIYAEYGDP
jgi:hypothetical protein